jgi:predicted DNA binding CopG/RHH family protein
MKTRKKPSAEILTPEQAIDFLESFQKMVHGIDEPSKAISLRVPENILRAYKLKAKQEKRGYQTMMIEALRQGLSQK